MKLAVMDGVLGVAGDEAPQTPSHGFACRQSWLRFNMCISSTKFYEVLLQVDVWPRDQQPTGWIRSVSTVDTVDSVSELVFGDPFVRVATYDGCADLAGCSFHAGCSTGTGAA